MILTNHAIVGAALASLVPNAPVAGFAIGFLSHFVLDAIPHWDYDLQSIKEDKNNPLNNEMPLNGKFLKDILKIGLDFFVGLSLSFLIFVVYFKYSILAIFCGVAGAMTPDALQFIYMKWRHEPLISLQRFHLWIHAEKIRG
jgi:hypothetical protein